MEDTPLRILVMVSRVNAFWGSLGLLLKTYSQKLFARWLAHVFLVFDIANTDYDPEKGHLADQNNLPVAIVRFGKHVQVYRASQPTQKQVNNDISRAHNLNGIGSIPPFVEDHASGTPHYLNPREPQLLRPQVHSHYISYATKHAYIAKP
ncbi:hypothetical protein P175DRAFT_0559597 [Aspergillus ochraceoroseus IBT 24754]|uniref:Uncharacterized protein n=1 Tax=Aspergillus ochraceoroseus IBT 24754 TaxID=1392256 RepID=A0A2T5LR56_9EURO|nr:uncharacterized protein P175DRAFT_0559597 [Aspergillus ochraceoroseus IBT 24754]PTU18770.1 hypothetical protein P175DRAFT_0559597 [Aspergillus ochraceoroseus IBT 24754]